jgi:hypothetical protein
MGKYYTNKERNICNNNGHYVYKCIIQTRLAGYLQIILYYVATNISNLTVYGVVFMSNFFKALFVSCLLFPVSLFAMNVGDYFQQGMEVDNYTSQQILITDPASSTIQNYPLQSGYYLEVKYASDQFTNPAGQTFIHTITINSAVDYSVICVVQSNLYVSTTTVTQNKPSTSNPSRCATSVYLKSGSSGTVYGFKINVT